MNEEINEKEKKGASSDLETCTVPPADAEKVGSKDVAVVTDQIPVITEQIPPKSEEGEVDDVVQKVPEKCADEIEPMEIDESVKPNQTTTVDEQMEVDSSQPVESSSKKPAALPSPPVDHALASKLAEVVKSAPETSIDTESASQSSSQANANVSTQSTENLISVLEGSGEMEQSTPAEIAVPASNSQPEQPAPAPLPPPKSTRKYIYKLKSKTGKVLKYVSSVPIVLKKPIIKLTKMHVEEEEEEKEEEEEEDVTQVEETKNVVSEKIAGTETDDIDSDNSTKENNVKENDVSRGVVQRIARKRGRPPLSQKTPVVTLDDQYSSDANDPKEAFKNGASSSSFGMQTRKRQLKFMPDGRLVTPGKKYKAATPSSADQGRDESSSSDSDVLSASDEDSQSDRKAKKSSSSSSSINVTKKFESAERSVADKKGKSKKVFDYESYFREKTAASSSEAKAEKHIATTAKGIVEIQKSTSAQPANAKNTAAAITKTPPAVTSVRTPTFGHNSSSSSLSKISTEPTSSAKKTVDPATLLSSLIGVPILPSQLNVVKFKPKVIQDRKTISTQKNVTFMESTPKKSGSGTELLRNASYKVTSRPSLQKILPKPSLSSSSSSSSSDRASTLVRKTMETPKAATTSGAAAAPVAAAAAALSPMKLTSVAPKLNSILKTPSSFVSAGHPLSPARDTPKFDNYTDTRVVKTKAGPRKPLKQNDNQSQQRKLNLDGVEDDEIKTIYELVQNVFEQLPSWNLHVIPDTNSFCIAQVSRGRMGIPILKKSIELNADFAAKVYVHQLHCKRYDGVYDTESKILSLIHEIDALAA